MVKCKRWKQRKLAFRKWNKNYDLKTVIRSTVSLCITALFAIYHGFLGMYLPSVWHGSICVFYLLLIAVRGMILFAEHKIKGQGEDRRHMLRQQVFRVTSALLLLINLVLIVPIALMAVFKRPVSIGLIPAIAMAAYTTYKITMAIIHIRKGKARHVLTRELRTINLVDALVSILTLQNTLIMVNSSSVVENDMLTLSAISSAVIYLMIAVITMKQFLCSKEDKKQLI